MDKIVTKSTLKVVTDALNKKVSLFDNKLNTEIKLQMSDLVSSLSYQHFYPGTDWFGFIKNFWNSDLDNIYICVYNGENNCGYLFLKKGERRGEDAIFLSFAFNNYNNLNQFVIMTESSDCEDNFIPEDSIFYTTLSNLQTNPDYLPLAAGEESSLNGPLYCKSIIPINNSSVIGAVDGNKFSFVGRVVSYQASNYIDFVKSKSFIGDPNRGMIDITIPAVTAMFAEITIAGLNLYKFLFRKNTGSPALSYKQIAGSPLALSTGTISGDTNIHILIGDSNLVLTECSIVKVEINCNTNANGLDIYNGVTISNNKSNSDYTTVTAVTEES